MDKNIKRFLVDHRPTMGDITVSIDFNYKNGKNDINDCIKSMVDFWTGSDDRLDDNDNDYLNTFLKQLCEKCMCVMADNNLSTRGLVAEFDDLEGWCKMDGSNGIEITDCTKPDFETQDDYDITSLK